MVSIQKETDYSVVGKQFYISNLTRIGSVYNHTHDELSFITDQKTLNSASINFAKYKEQLLPPGAILISQVKNIKARIQNASSSNNNNIGSIYTLPITSLILTGSSFEEKFSTLSVSSGYFAELYDSTPTDTR